MVVFLKCNNKPPFFCGDNSLLCVLKLVDFRPRPQWFSLLPAVLHSINHPPPPTIIPSKCVSILFALGPISTCQIDCNYRGVALSLEFAWPTAICFTQKQEYIYLDQDAEPIFYHTVSSPMLGGNLPPGAFLLAFCGPLKNAEIISNRSTIPLFPYLRRRGKSNSVSSLDQGCQNQHPLLLSSSSS
jgi:hypothetical protein